MLGVKHKKPCALAGIEELVAVSLLSTPTAESFKSPQEFRLDWYFMRTQITTAEIPYSTYKSVVQDLLVIVEYLHITCIIIRIVRYNNITIN